MASNYKKCTECGSLNVVKILYGMPSEEGTLLYEEGKIQLGGCCVITPNPEEFGDFGMIDFNPEYYCKDCETEWGKQEAIDHAYHEINGIKASVGGFHEGHVEVEIDFETRKLTWNEWGRRTERYFERTLKQSSLDSFKEELKTMGLLKWKSKYVEPDILDGTQWSIALMREGRNLYKYGSNVFPDEWDDFCRAMSSISGGNFD